MRICFTVDSMNSGGAERVTSVLANEFFKNGHQVYIVMVSALKNESFYKLDGVNLICLMQNYEKKLGFKKRVNLLRNTIKQLSPDIVISFLPHVIIYTFFALRHTGIKLICSERNDPTKLSFKYRVALKHIFKNADGNVFQTNYARSAYGKCVSKKTVIINNPISNDISFKEVENRKNVVLSVGRLVEQKNIKMLIDAFDLFSKQQMNSRFVLKIYGIGKMQESLQDYASRKSSRNSIVFMGNSKTWIEDEYDSKMFILTSNFEGMPNALLEALVVGIPCISTDCPVGGPRELINDGENGFLVSVGDVKELAKKMSLVCDKTVAKKVSDANKNKHHLFCSKEIASKWIDFIEYVIRG